MTTRCRDADRVYVYACELAAHWRSILSQDGKAAGVTAIRLDDTSSDEVQDEHRRRVLDTAAAMPLAVEMLAEQSARQIEMVFPVAIGSNLLGWGVRYAQGER